MFRVWGLLGVSVTCLLVKKEDANYLVCILATCDLFSGVRVLWDDGVGDKVETSLGIHSH